MHFNPLFGAVAGLFLLISGTALIKHAEQGRSTAYQTHQPQSITNQSVARIGISRSANNEPGTDLTQRNPPSQAKAQQDRSSSVWTNWIQAVSAAFVAVFTYSLMRLQSRQVSITSGALQETANATKQMERQNEINMRPSITAHQIHMDMRDGEIPTGKVLLTNVGLSTARVLWGTLFVLCTSEPLPTIHPAGDKPNENDRIIWNKQIDAGDVYWWEFSGKETLSRATLRKINSTKPSLKLYIIGLVHYEGTGSIRAPRYTKFCRVYDNKLKRWAPAENPDYELLT